MPGTYISPAETGFYLTGTRFYDPEICRFINADGYISTGQGVLGNNMYVYCGNNPVNRMDPTGQFWSSIWEFLKTAGNEIGNTISALAPAYSVCGGLTVVDGPLPIGDVLGAGGALVLSIGATAHGIYSAARLYETAKSKEKEKVATITPQSNPTYIYRHRGTNPGNLVLSKNDVDTNSGLSFSTMPQPNSWRTTIEQVNSTGVLMAIQDGTTHVSVYPVGGTVADWRSAGTSSIWTQTLIAISTKIKWDGEN